MKTAYFGWEAANMKGNTVTWSVPVLSPIIIRGYQINLAMMVTKGPGTFQGGQAAEILVQAALDNTDLNGDFGPPVINPGVGGNPVQNGIFATAILKTWVANPPTANAVNEMIVQPYLDLAVPAGIDFTMLAQHIGYPMDFEVQGVLYYDNG